MRFRALQISWELTGHLSDGLGWSPASEERRRSGEGTFRWTSVLPGFNGEVAFYVTGPLLWYFATSIVTKPGSTLTDDCKIRGEFLRE